MQRMKAKLIRDHVSTYGKDVSKAVDKKFGISRSLIVKAAMGDDKALIAIGDMGKVGDRLLLAMPTIRENLKSYIEGTKEYNLALADVYKTGGKAAAAIDKAAGDVTLANTNYVNLIEEYKTKLFADLDKESQRHDDAMDVIELTAWVDSQMVTATQKAQLEGISNRPFVAQIQADADYEDRKISHLLENGSDSDLSLLPKKEFATNPLIKFWNNVRQAFS